MNREVETVLAELWAAVLDGDIAASEAGHLVSKLFSAATVSKVIDAALPTGPLDALDDPVIRALVEAIWTALERRSLEELKADADAAQRAGRDRKATRLRRRLQRRLHRDIGLGRRPPMSALDEARFIGPLPATTGNNQDG